MPQLEAQGGWSSPPQRARTPRALRCGTDLGVRHRALRLVRKLAPGEPRKVRLDSSVASGYRRTAASAISLNYGSFSGSQTGRKGPATFGPPCPAGEKSQEMPPKNTSTILLNYGNRKALERNPRPLDGVLVGQNPQQSGLPQRSEGMLAMWNPNAQA